MFMTVVVTDYIVIAPEGFVRFFHGTPVATIEMVGLVCGLILSAVCTLGFFKTLKKEKISEAHA